MDPEEALRRAADALNTAQPVQCLEYLIGYFMWRCKAGYQPSFDLRDGNGWQDGDRIAERLAWAAIDALEDKHD
jgi:hypothetical protein